MGCCGDSKVDSSEKSKGDIEMEEHGKPREYDPSFNGPIKKRSCTDVLCCLLYLVVLLGTIIIGYLAFTRGDPKKLLFPTDSSGNICGVQNYDSQANPTTDLTSKPYVFFFDLLVCARLGPAVLVNGCPTPQTCVSSCPNSTWFWGVSYAKELAGVARTTTRSELQFCQYTVDPFTSSKSIPDLVDDNDCAGYTIEMSPLVGRCIPAIFKEIIDKAAGLYTTWAGNNYTITTGVDNTTVTGQALEEGTKWLGYFLSVKEYGEKILQDVTASWWLMLVGLGVACVVSFLWILLMRFIAGPMVWISIFFFAGIFGFATYYCISKYFEIKNMPASEGWPSVVTTDFTYYLNLYNTWLVLGCIAGFLLLVVLIVILFLRKRVLIAIALIKITSRATGNMMFTLLWPIIPFALTLACWLYWGAQAVYLASMGIAEYKGNFTNESLSASIQSHVDGYIQSIDCNPDTNDTVGNLCAFLKYGGDAYSVYLQAYNLFFLFWGVAFVSALDQMVLAGSFASYYWAFNKPKDIPAFPVTASMWRAFRYHLGSMAFGSLLIAIIKSIRVVLEYLDAKLKKSENAIAKFIVKCLKCCFWCLEKFMKFLNKNAYILIAVYGYNFCGAAKEAFFLIVRNIVRVVVVDKVTDFVLFIGKLVVTGIMALISYGLFTGNVPTQYLKEFLLPYVPTLNFYLVPVILISMGTFIIACAFFQVFEMGVDTMFMCFLEDLEKHDGSEEKPYYMSKELLEIVGKKNVVKSADD